MARHCHNRCVALELDLAELCERTGVTVRTVRYYVQQGLLPSPGTGPNARYQQEHLDRLLLIRKMQREQLPLAEIRRRLDKPRALARLARELHETPPASASVNSAADYVRAVLAATTTAAATAGPHTQRTQQPQQPPPTTAARSRWERIALGVDVELHVREPQTPAGARRLARIVEAAQHILSEPD